MQSIQNLTPTVVQLNQEVATIRARQNMNEDRIRALEQQLQHRGK